MKTTASGPITSWQIDGGKIQTVADFIFLGFKITMDSDCSHQIKRHVLPGRKAMTNLESVLKSRDIPLLTKVYIVKAMVFPIDMHGFESWTIKKAKCWRTDACELWCWRRLLRVPWTARRSNQSILKEISPKYSLGGLTLEFQYFGQLMQRADSLEKTLMLEKIESRSRRGWQRMRWLDDITDSMDMSLSKLWEMSIIRLQCRRAWFDSCLGKMHWRRDRPPTPVFLGFPCGLADKESACNVGDLGSIPGLGRCPGEAKGYPLQDSGLEIFMDCIVRGVTNNWTWLSHLHFTSLGDSEAQGSLACCCPWGCKGSDST